MVFGVVGPFLYEVKLGFSPATYGLIALLIGVANLTDELACGALAQRLTAWRLASGAWAVFFLGAVVLVSAMLALVGIGVLDP